MLFVTLFMGMNLIESFQTHLEGLLDKPLIRLHRCSWGRAILNLLCVPIQRQF
jgi:hypothetical protein